MSNVIDGADLDARHVMEAKRRHIGLFNSGGQSVPFHHVGAGRMAFLCLSGLSLGAVDLKALTARGITTMAVNNSPATFALQGVRMPDLWTCVDFPNQFIEQIWKDATITKFCPYAYLGHKIKTRNGAGALIESAFKVEECPNTLFYERNSFFNSERWLTEPTFNWGNASDVVDNLGNKGSRSVMLVALKLLWYLGFKRVHLLGADFKMEMGRDNYSFPQERTKELVASNNSTYSILNSRFSALRPHFERAGFEVMNCTPESGLKSFDFMDLEAAIRNASSEVTAKRVDTQGHYDI